MHRWLPIAALLAGIAAAHAADPREVWEQAVKAKGGRERLRGVHSLAVYMKPADVNLSGPATNWLLVFPDRYFEFDGARAGGHQSAMVVDGTADRVAMDATGIHALEQMARRCRAQGTALVLSEVHSQPLRALARARVSDIVGDPKNVAESFGEALERAERLLGAVS